MDTAASIANELQDQEAINVIQKLNTLCTDIDKHVTAICKEANLDPEKAWLTSERRQASRLYKGIFQWLRTYMNLEIEFVPNAGSEKSVR